ncbi:MAG: Asd/ArgC dimerization domain-containing protein [Gammaproteobacteria bacterium]
MTQKNNIAIVGAGSLKGEAFIARLAEAEVDVGEVFLLDNEAMAGEHVEFGRRDKRVLLASDFDFSQVQYVICLGEAALTEQLYPALEAGGCAVIDASGYLGQRQDVSLATLQADDVAPRVVAIPETTTLQLWLVLQPLLQETAITELHVSVLQCAAQGGKALLEDLGQQTARLLGFQEAQPAQLGKQLAFNVIPQVGALDAQGESSSEAMIRDQIARLFVLPRTEVDVTMLWSPVFYGDTVTASVRLRDALAMEYMETHWQANPLLAYAANQVVTPVSDASGKSVISLSRVRAWQTADEHGLVTFCSVVDPTQLSAMICILVLQNQLLV